MFGTLMNPANWVAGIAVFLLVFISIGLVAAWTDKR